jgi:hypothetical protein
MHISKANILFICSINLSYFLIHSAKVHAKNGSKMATNLNSDVCGYRILTQNGSRIAIKSFPNFHFLPPQGEKIPRSFSLLCFSDLEWLSRSIDKYFESCSSKCFQYVPVGKCDLFGICLFVGVLNLKVFSETRVLMSVAIYSKKSDGAHSPPAPTDCDSL